MDDSRNADDLTDNGDDDLSDYLHIFLDETEEQLDDLVETMLVLESSPGDAASLAAAFRLLHSIKGAAGMMGLDQITVLTHHLETRFERLRSGSIELDRITTNLTLRCIDFLRQCVVRLRSGESLSAPDELLEELRLLEEQTENSLHDDDEPHADDLIQEVMQSSGRTFREVTSSVERDTTASEAPKPTLSDDPLPDLGTDYHVAIEFAAGLLLKDFKAQSVATQLGNLGEIKATRPEMDELGTDSLETFDVIVNTTANLDQIMDAVIADGMASVEIRVPRDADAKPLRRYVAPQPVPAEASPIVNQVVAPEIRREGMIPEEMGFSDPSSSNTASPPVASKAVETMRVDIDRLDHLMNLAGELVVNRAQFIQVASQISPGLRKSKQSVGSPSVGPDEFCELLSKTIERLGKRLESDSPVFGEQADDWALTLKQLQTGLDAVREHTRLWESNRHNFNQLDEAIDKLSRVSDSLQRGVLGTRMVPVGPLLNRFKRVVRDLSQQRDKAVDLRLEGETTELDKRMIDALGDPLVHLVRNSMDHGLESPDERVAAGKPATGTITLSARHSGNQVTLTITDDGRGIDANSIRNSLVKKNLMTRSDADSLSDDAAIASIFRPGFSTAEAITDLSGRGVGMDIVKSRIESLNGTIDIQTVVGRGTSFTLKLPLTLAIIGSLLVRIRGIVFAIPKDDVREIVIVARRDILDVHGKQTFEVRGRYTPLVCIEDLFHWNDPQRSTLSATRRQQSSDKVEIAILQSDGQPMGLLVDQSIGSQDVVIKSLSENFVNLPGLAGASILGDGSVALMLDVAALRKMS